MNEIDLNNRNAIVTGGARGIGRAIAERLLASGARVSLWDVDAAALAQASAEMGTPDTVQPPPSISLISPPSRPPPKPR